MEKEKKDKMLKMVSETIEKMENKDFFVYFYVIDTKGNPSSQVEYIYETALTLKKFGYNVAILHQENDFVGVGDWLGEEYANIEHHNIEKENVEISACDFLFIPEIFANVMMQTKKLPCKRVILIQNYKHICEFLPVSQSMETLSITDAIVTTEEQDEKISKYFPTLNTHIVHPSIKKMFRKNTEPQEFIINVICKEQSIVHQIVKPFYWENPIYKWVSFRDLRGTTQELFANALREAAITVWVDDDTVFGYSLLEALRSGSLVIAKIPNNPPAWMLDNDGNLIDSVLWVSDIDEMPDVLAKTVRSWTLDRIPQTIYDNQDKTNDLFSEEQQCEEIKKVYINDLFGKRLSDFKEVKKDVENNVFEN